MADHIRCVRAKTGLKNRAWACGLHGLSAPTPTPTELTHLVSDPVAGQQQPPLHRARGAVLH